MRIDHIALEVPPVIYQAFDGVPLGSTGRKSSRKSLTQVSEWLKR